MRAILKHIICLLLAPALLLAGGCIYDDGEMMPEPVVPNTIGYISVQLFPANGETRAVGELFDYGQKEEFALAPGNHHFALFYGGGQAAPLAVAALGNVAANESSNHAANTTVTLAAIAARSEQKDLLERFEECFVILNADLSSEALWTTPKEQLLDLIVDAPFCTGSDGKRYLTMCNAVYADGGKLVIASKVDPEKIYESYLEALEMAWKGEAAVEAHIERLAAKLTLSFDNEQYNNPEADRVFSPAENKIIFFSHLEEDIPRYYEDFFNYRVRITGWGMNALEKQSYLFRKINPAGNYFTGWNSPVYYRAFWSEDCNYRYQTGGYPWQYRRAIDNPDLPDYERHGSLLQNLSFEELEEHPFAPCIYTPENTYDFADRNFEAFLDGRPEVLAGTHLIVCAELLVNLDGPNAFEPYDLYRDRNGNFYRSEEECFLALVTKMNNTLKSHSFLKFTYYDWSQGGNQQTLFAKTNGEYSLYYNNTKLTPANIRLLAGSLTADANVRGGDGQRLIWMKGLTIQNDAGQSVQIYSNIDEVDATKDRWLREATENDVRSLLLQYIGVIDHFQDGKMYYAIPVGYTKEQTAAAAVNQQYDIYGVVRNSVYKIVIQDVAGLGTSVDKVTDPIVPNQVSTHDHLFINVDILDWHLTEEKVPGTVS